MIHCQVDGKPGLHVQTYSGVDSTTPAGDVVRLQPLDCNWSGGVPAGVEADTYRMEFRALLLADEQQRDLLVQVSGRVRILVDGQEVLNDWPDDANEGHQREHRITLPAPRDPAGHDSP